MSYYTASGKPVNQTRGLASEVRDEFQLIQAGFNKLPSPGSVAGGNANYGVDTGLANAYVVSIGTEVTSYADGLTVNFKAINANTGASTVNVNSLGIKTIARADGQPLTTGDIIAGQIVEISYSTTSGKFQLRTIGSLANDLADAVSSAAASASAAANYAAALSGTSASSVAITTGSKAFTASTGKQWAAGQFLTVASSADPTNYMHGQVTSYDITTGALVIGVTNTGGSGTHSDWIVNVSGTRGPSGSPGSVYPTTFVSTNTSAAAWNTYTLTAACTLTLPPSPTVNDQVGVIVLPGVSGAVVSPGAEKIRDVSGSMNVDSSPFDAILTYTGATHGWI